MPKKAKKRMKTSPPLPFPFPIVSIPEEEEKPKTDERCEDCICCYLEGETGWVCLSGHAEHHPCDDYEKAVFFMVRGQTYTPQQLLRLRTLERSMKEKFRGE